MDVTSLDQGAFESVMDVARDGSWRNPWSDRSGTKRWMSERLDGGNIDVRDVEVGYVLH
jgi:hypothetical protein